MAENTEQLLIQIDVDADAAIKQSGEQINKIAELREATNRLKAEQKAMREEGKQNEQQYQKNAEQIARNEAQVKNLSTALNNNQKIVKAITNDTEGTTGAYQRLNEEYQVAAQRAKDLAVAYGVNSKEAVSATNAAKVMSDRLKDVDASVGQNQRNVGNYSSVLQQLPAGFQGVVTGATGVKDAFNLLSKNPWMAVLQLLIPLIMGLGKQFKAFAPIMDLVQQATAALGAAFTSLVNNIVSLFNGTKSLGDFFKSFAGDMKEAATESANLAKAQQDLDDVIRVNAVNQAKYKNQIDELILQSKDRTKSEKERIALINQALALEEKAFAEEKRIADEQVRIAENTIINGANLTKSQQAELRKRGVSYALWLQNTKKLSDEDIDALKKAQIDRENITNRSIQLREKAINRQNALEEKAAEDAEKRNVKQAETEKKRRETRIKEMEASLKIMVASEDEITETGLVNRVRKEQEIIKQKMAWNLLTQEEGNLALLESQNKYDQAFLALQKKRYSEEMAAYKTYVSQKVEEDVAESDRDIERLYINEENRLLAMQEGLDKDFALREFALQEQRTKEIANSELTASEIALINAKYKQAELQLEQEKFNAKLGLASSLMGSLSKVFGEGTKAGKAAASAQVAIDGIAAAFSAYKSMIGSGIPAPFNFIAGGVAAAGVLASSARSIADIWKVKETGTKSVSSSAISTSASTAVSATSRATSSVAANQSSLTQSAQVTSGVKAAFSEMPQTVLVVDDVTAAQNRKVGIREMNTI